MYTDKSGCGRQECEVRGATIVYATHIFDGLEGWLTHLAFISQGNLLKGTPCLARITSCLYTSQAAFSIQVALHTSQAAFSAPQAAF